MAAPSIEKLEARAADAEKRLTALEGQQAKGGPAQGAASPVAAFKKELTQLREVLMAAKEEVAAMEKERDEALKQVSKLKYQREHVKKQLREQDEKTGHPAEKA